MSPDVRQLDDMLRRVVDVGLRTFPAGPPEEWWDIVFELVKRRIQAVTPEAWDLLTGDEQDQLLQTNNRVDELLQMRKLAMAKVPPRVM